MLSAQKMEDAILSCPRNVQQVSISDTLQPWHHGSGWEKSWSFSFTCKNKQICDPFLQISLKISCWHPCKGINHISVWQACEINHMVVQGTFHSLYLKVTVHWCAQQNRLSMKTPVNDRYTHPYTPIWIKKKDKKKFIEKQTNDDKVTSRESYLMLTLVTA